VASSESEILVLVVNNNNNNNNNKVGLCFVLKLCTYRKEFYYSFNVLDFLNSFIAI